jgi:hypothetical protein
MPRPGRAAGKVIGSRVPRTDCNRGPPVAGEAGAIRGKGTDEELLGSTLTEEAGRRAVALGHGYGGWGAAREDADLTGSTRFEAAPGSAAGHFAKACEPGVIRVKVRRR